MNCTAVRHVTSREFIYPTDRRSLIVKLECLATPLSVVSVIVWHRQSDEPPIRVQLQRFSALATDPYYFATLSFSSTARYLLYYFEIVSPEETSYYSPIGLTETLPKRFFSYQSTNELDVISVPKWSMGAVGYHIFVDRFYNGDKSNDPVGVQDWNAKPSRLNFFGGDLRGIIEKIDYLVDLGISIIFLTPLFLSVSNHKYDTVDYFQIDPKFGTTEDVIELVEICHSHSINVILDGVFNHIGYFSIPFQDAILQGKASKYWDWFYIQGEKIDTNTVNYECVGDFKWMPKLRYANQKLRKFIKSVGEYWVKKAHIDGWRLDVADEVDYTFWQEFRAHLKQINPECLLVGETWSDGRDLIRGDEMDSIMNYQFRENVLDYFVLDSLKKEAFQLRIESVLYSYPFPVHTLLYNLLGSHDTPRIKTVCGNNFARLKLAIAFQMTFPGMPVVYYGDEIGLEGGTDPDCRTTMKWDAIDLDIYGFTKKLIALRNAHPALRFGDFRHHEVDQSVYAFSRTWEETTLLMLFNPTGESIQVSIDPKQLAVSNRVSRGKSMKVTLNAFDMLVLEISQTDEQESVQIIS